MINVSTIRVSGWDKDSPQARSFVPFAYANGTDSMADWMKFSHQSLSPALATVTKLRAAGNDVIHPGRE
jgi:hypothetical protein